MGKDLKVLFVSSEVAPYIKSGGLGDVAGSLPKELTAHGVDIRVCFPKYQDINYGLIKDLTHVKNMTVTLGWRRQEAQIYRFHNGVTHYLIGNDHYFNRSGLYGYEDDYDRFAFFTKAALDLLHELDFQADVVQFNDWQTGLGPLYLNDQYRAYTFYDKTKSLYTIHNLQYQGSFNGMVLGEVGLNGGYDTLDKLHQHGNISYMKGGIVYANAISTVSQTYAHEIQTPAYGYGMDGILCTRAKDIYGIINGIDYKENDPARDPRIYQPYSKESLAGKYANKEALKRDLGLHEGEMPLVAIISRMVDQKGFDLIALAMEELMHKELQMVVLGTGDSRYENMFKHYEWKYRGKLSANIKFDTYLAQKIYAGSDMFLMPSLFEPCGLGQMFAMRYGSVPIVRRTGGLNDTVRQYSYEEGSGNGFIFNDYDAHGMMWAVNEALWAYSKEPDHWRRIVENCMDSDFSWAHSAEAYIALYRGLIAG